MPSTLTAIRVATDRVEDAQEQLGELAAMVALHRLVRKATSDLILSALQSYSTGEVAAVTGQSRQHTNRQKRRVTPSERNPS
jgi:hypothetical protein